MSYSKIAKYYNPSPNHNITNETKMGVAIHCYVGQVTVAGALNNARFNSYDPQNGASCQYIICTDGTVVCNLDESLRSWCTSSKLDANLITIECACDSFAPYKINDKVYKALVELLVDICIRNNFNLKYSGSSSQLTFENVNGKKVATKCDWRKGNVILHRWTTMYTSKKSCPGDDIVSKIPAIVKAVNLKVECEKLNKCVPYRVKTTAKIRRYEKLGGKVKNWTKIGDTLIVSKVEVFNGELWGKGKNTGLWYRLKYTKRK